MYANSASRLLLQDWGCAVGEPAPLFWQQEVTEALARQTNKAIDVAYGDITFSFFITPIVEADYVNVYGRDITDRKRAEEALRESEHRLADIIDFLPDATFAINLKGEVIAWNRALEELTGAPKEELIGKGDFAYAVPFYGKTGPMLIDRIFQDWKEIEENYDFLIRREDQLIAEAFVPALRGGKGAYLWGIASPLYDSSGSIVGAIESLRDITERKRTEEALRESEERYRSLFDTMAQGVVYQNSAGRIIHANPAAEKILGLSLDQMQGRTSVDPRWRAIHEDGSDFPGETHPAIVALRTGREVRDVVMGSSIPPKKRIPGS